MSEKSKNAVKLVSSIMIITLMGKVLGLFRDQLLAWNYGVGVEANAFTSASRIPRIFFDAVFASAVSSSFIPVFNEYLQKDGKKRAFDFSNNFVSIVIVVTALMTIFGILGASFLQGLFAGGFEGETAILCTELLRILFPMLIFTGVAFSYVGVLQSLDEFTVPAAMSTVSNGIIILYYFVFGTKFGVKGLAVAFLFGWFMQMAIQIPPLYKKGYRFKFFINFKDEGLKKVGALMLPVMVSTWIQPINIAINGRYASGLFGGSGSSIVDYANNLYSIIVGVFVLSIANVIFPKLSRQTANNEEKEYGETINSTMKVLLFLLIPMMFGLISLSTPIVRLIYEWKEFDHTATLLTGRALAFFSVGMIGFGIQTILSRAFYALQDGKTPLITGVVSIGVNVIFCHLLVGRMDVGGLALASSLSSIVSAVLLIIPMKKKSKDIMGKGFLTATIKMFVSAILMTVVVIVLKDIIYNSVADNIIGRIIVVAVPTIIGVIVYMVSSYILKIEESQFVFNFINKFISKFKK